MARYIDQDALLNKMQERHEDLVRDYGDYDNYVTGFGDAIELLENASAADVREVKYAKNLQTASSGHLNAHIAIGVMTIHIAAIQASSNSAQIVVRRSTWRMTNETILLLRQRHSLRIRQQLRRVLV